MDKDSWVHLIYHALSDLESLILIRIISKECTLSLGRGHVFVTSSVRSAIWQNGCFILNWLS